MPKSTDTPTRVVRANDLTQALARVRLAFGKDALVLGTRTVTVRDPESMRPRSLVEVTVAEPAAQREAVAGGGGGQGWTAAYAEQEEVDTASEPEPVADPLADTDDDVAARVHRIDAIAGRVRELMSRVDEVAVDDEDAPYPLEDALRRQGTGERTIRHLAGSFSLAARGGDVNATAARRHLSKFVRGTRAIDLSQVRGEHWFLGRAGVGKTTMTLYLAAELKRAGVDVAVIAPCPSHAGDVQRLRAAERAMGIPVSIVDDVAGYARAREASADADTVLVDTPCFVGKELPVLPPDDAQRHLVVPLGEDRELLRGHLGAARGWQADCLAISQMDLFPRPGRMVDLLVEAGRPVSLLQGRSGDDLCVRIARGETLMEAVLGDDPAEGL